MARNEMDSDQDVLDAYEARELTDWMRKKEAQQRYENAARRAHKIRMTARLLFDPVPDWDDMGLSSQRHLISDAENVAENPSINLDELTKMYQDRLMAWGDTANPDRELHSVTYQSIEDMVLDELKATLSKSAASPLPVSYQPTTEA